MLGSGERDPGLCTFCTDKCQSRVWDTYTCVYACTRVCAHVGIKGTDAGHSTVIQISNRNLGGHESERAGGNKAGLLQKYTRKTKNASVEGIFQSFVFL